MDNLHQIIDESQTELIETLKRWISKPSVKSAAEADAPFGAQVKLALETALADAQAMGFDTRNFDNYAGDVRMGPTGVDPLGILVHLDVVPVGDGWTMEPFAGTVEEDRVIGRGTSDDKGPAVAALFAMKAIQKAGIPLKREVRLIFGCDEESGWEDIAYYQAHCDMPRTGFSPDASYPVINTEKGMLVMELHGKPAEDGLKVLKMAVGERHNVIPGIATALIESDPDECARINRLAKEMTLNVTAVPAEGGVKLTAMGTLGHAAYPEAARNALGELLLMLRALGVTGGLKTLADTIGVEYDGQSLGVSCRDDTSGALTCNLGVLRYDENGLYAVLDFRYPLLANSDRISQTVKDTVAPTVEAVVVSVKAPHHVAPNSELVTALLDAYHDETGRTRECISTGGGTYARCLAEGVAFGATFPEDDDVAHQANEFILIKSLMQTVNILARAIVMLAGAELPTD
ncbi:MAG: Sapep family Mn(2+)-dependent dipeptidase [Candidatus Pacebacteria bacterium]|nr:Sapep family Mn(2+)-dependent dipeptidase [Candidatus Paceibacterota bacterium]